MDSKSKEESILSVKDMIFILRKRIWVILLTTLLFILITFSVTEFLIEPVYTSTTNLYVMNREKENQITSADLTASTTLTSDFEFLVTSRSVLEQVIKLIGLDISVDEMAEKISVTNPAGTRILKIRADDINPVVAKKIADTVAKVASEQIVELMGVEQVNIVDRGDLPNSPSSPDLLRNLIFAAMLGIIISSLIVFILYVFDDTIKTTDDIERYLDISILGTVPVSANTTSAKRRRKTKKKKIKKVKKTKKRGNMYGIHPLNKSIY